MKGDLDARHRQEFDRVDAHARENRRFTVDELQEGFPYFAMSSTRLSQFTSDREQFLPDGSQEY
jgi:hypothetical protein